MFWLVFNGIWLLFDLSMSLLLDVAFDASGTRKRNRVSGSEELAWAGVLALAVGFFMGCIAPERLLTKGPFPGVSLIVVPSMVGLAMHFWGQYRRTRGRGPSRLATAAGGAVIGFGLAAGRLAGMAYFRFLA